MTASRPGNMPDNVFWRLRISRFRRSLGLFDQIWRHSSFGNAVKASISARAPSRCSATAGSLSANASTTRSNWASLGASGWS